MTCGYLSLLDTSEISPCLIKSLDTSIKNLLLILYFKIDELEGSWYNRIPSVMQILYKLIGSKYKATCSTFSAHSHLWCMQLVSWYCSTISHTIFHAGNARFSLRHQALTVQYTHEFALMFKPYCVNTTWHLPNSQSLVLRNGLLWKLSGTQPQQMGIHAVFQSPSEDLKRRLTQEHFLIHFKPGEVIPSQQKSKSEVSLQ